MKHQFIVEAECDGRFAARDGEELRDFAAERIWKLQGLIPNTVCTKVIDKDVVLISKAEYEQLKATIRHLENMK